MKLIVPAPHHGDGGGLTETGAVEGNRNNL